MKLKIRRDDVLMSLDGVIYLEGPSGAKVGKTVKTNKRNALGMLRNVAPNLKASQVTIDPHGRVRIKHPKFAELGRLLAADADTDAKTIGKFAPRSRVVRPPRHGEDDGRAELDFLCLGDDGQANIVCGEFNDEDSGCDINAFCGWS